MRYPTMGRSPRNAVSVPALSGGVNLNDALNLVDDNQLTDCKNIWYKDGMLQTRPGLKKHEASFGDDEALADRPLEIYSSDAVGFINGKKYTAVIKRTTENDELTNVEVPAEELFVFGEDGLLFSSIITNWSERPDSYYEDKSLVFWGKPISLGGIGLFVLQTNKSFALKTSVLHEVVQRGSGKYRVELVTNRYYYSPHILINGKGDSYSELPTDIKSEYAPASMFEGHSLFSDAEEKYCFVTDGISKTFTIPNDLYLTLVQVIYTDPTSGITYESELIPNYENNSDESAKTERTVDLGDSGYTVTTNVSSSVFEIKNDNGEALPSSLGKIANNLVFRVRYNYFPYASYFDEAEADENYKKQKEWLAENRPDSKLADMKQAIWFGGSASGISSGTRLFLAGSEKEKNLLVWSDLNNPTYFPENNYAYVGSSSQRITALAKQDDMLVIFKENEIFYTTYVEGASYTAEDVISGKVTDVTTLSAIFPITQIHSEIGCDLPNTIQLCGNRLVWACKDGNVYTLKSADQYSTANVAKISSLVDKRLKEVIKTEGNLESNFSAIYNGHYLLMFGNSVFVMDFDHYYFNSLPAYSDTKKAQRKLIWYYWELPNMEGSIFKNFFSVNDQCYLYNVSTYYPASGGSEYANYTMFELTEEALQDNCLKQNSPSNSGDHMSLEVVTVPIESVIQTKMFDFGAMERFKSIEQLYVEFGKADGEIDLEYLTERGRLNDISVELNYEKVENAPEFIKTKRFLPCIKRALRFGLRLTTKGRIALGGILIKFKYMGVTR